MRAPPESTSEVRAGDEAVRRAVLELLPAIREDPHPGLLRGSLHVLYDVFLALALVVISPWLLWSCCTKRGFGRMVAARLGAGLPGLGRRPGPRVLLHGVSVGEVKGAHSVARAIEQARPDVEVVVSTTTNTGDQLARSLFPERAVVRYPADPSPIVARFLRRVRPSAVVLVELEIWPNFLRACNRRGIPVAVVNGRITERSHGRYHVFRRLLPQFDRISLFCVQSEEYAERFRRLGVDPRRLLLTGNVKADALHVGAVYPGEELAQLVATPPGVPCVVAGSTHEPEELHVARACRDAVPEARLVLVPRHPDRCPEIARALGAEGTPAQLLSRLRTGAELPDPGRPLLVDTIGELERVYALADLVFVGGSLVPHGGQNLLEPAAQGRAVLFGPHVENFQQEARLLLAAGGSRQVATPDELARALAELLADPTTRAAMGAAGREAVARQQGATGRTLAALAHLSLLD